MKIANSVAISAALVLMSMASVADAGVTCKVVPSWCPSDSGNSSGGSNGNGGGSKTTSVPEPASLALFGTGLAAVGAAAIRRRRKNK